MPFINSYAAKAATSASVSGKPNIIFIMADDLGWGDVGFTKDLIKDDTGRTRIQTPNLDSIARSGIRFKQYYSGSCTCSPTRISSMLGIKSERIGVQYACRGTKNAGIPWGMPTIPKLLATAGYSTGFVGKWHMGGYDAGSVTKRESGGTGNFPGPNDLGFEDAYFRDAKCHIEHEHAKPHTVYVGNPSSAVCTRYNDSLAGESKPGANLIENNTDYAMLLLEKYAKQSNPFYLQLWHFVPHAPTEHIDGNEDGCTGLSGGYADFCTMVHCLDHNIKRLFGKMEQLGIAQNTFVLFTSDNGPHAGKADPLAGGKFDFKEGGIRMPSFAYWKGTIAAGGVCDQACTSTDLLPTFCDVGQAALPKVLVEKDYFDGVSMKETILNGKAVPNRQLYWKRSSNTNDGQAIIENGRFKYRRTRKGEDVYTDLSVDPYESGRSTVPQGHRNPVERGSCADQRPPTRTLFAGLTFLPVRVVCIQPCNKLSGLRITNEVMRNR